MTMTIEDIHSFQTAVEAVQRQVQDYPVRHQPFMLHFLTDRMFIRHGAMTDDWTYPTYQDLMLGLGVLRDAPFFVPDEPLFLEAEVQMCYSNCFTAVCELPGYTYVEGYARTDLLIARHAWLEDPQGRIVDPTWANHLEDRDSATYYGIKFDTEFVIRRASETGWTSIFEREWSARPPDDFPSLRYGFKLNDAGLVIDYGRRP